jgi:hypothetical protein
MSEKKKRNFLFDKPNSLLPSVLACNGKEFNKFFKEFFSALRPLFRFQLKWLTIFLTLSIILIPGPIKASDGAFPQILVENIFCDFMGDNHAGNNFKGELIPCVQVIEGICKCFIKINESVSSFLFSLEEVSDKYPCKSSYDSEYTGDDPIQKSAVHNFPPLILALIVFFVVGFVSGFCIYLITCSRRNRYTEADRKACVTMLNDIKRKHGWQ